MRACYDISIDGSHRTSGSISPYCGQIDVSPSTVLYIKPGTICLKTCIQFCLAEGELIINISFKKEAMDRLSKLHETVDHGLHDNNQERSTDKWNKELGIDNQWQFFVELIAY